MKIVITEDQKKKLFIPRGIDERVVQFDNEIKKFLNSIKDSIVWEYLGSIETSFNIDNGFEEASYHDFNGISYLQNLSEIKNVFIDEYGEEEGKNEYYDFHNKVVKITEYMEGLLRVRGEGEVTNVWNILKHLGYGHFEFTQQREVKIIETIKEIKI